VPSIVVLISGVALAATPVAPPPVGDDQHNAARALFQEGLTHADAGRWRDAADRFERANALRPSPEITYNLSTSLLHQGRLVRAAELLRHLSDDPAATPAVRGAAQARLSQVVPRIAHVTVTVSALPPDATLLLNGRPLEHPFLGVAVPVDPAPHAFQVRRSSGASATRRLVLADGERLRLDADPLLAQTAPPVSPAPPTRRWWLWGVAGAAAAAAVVVGATVMSSSGGTMGDIGTFRVGTKK